MTRVTNTSVSIKAKFFLVRNSLISERKVILFLQKVFMGSPYSIESATYQRVNNKEIIKVKILRQGWAEVQEFETWDEDGNKDYNDYLTPFGIIEVITDIDDPYVTFNIELFLLPRYPPVVDRYAAYNQQFKDYVNELKTLILSAYEKLKLRYNELTTQVLNRGVDSTSISYAYDTSLLGKIVRLFLGI